MLFPEQQRFVFLSSGISILSVDCLSNDDSDSLTAAISLLLLFEPHEQIRMKTRNTPGSLRFFINFNFNIFILVPDSFFFQDSVVKLIFFVPEINIIYLNYNVMIISKNKLLFLFFAFTIFNIKTGYLNTLGYFMHSGGHGSIASDWSIFLEFIKKYL